MDRMHMVLQTYMAACRKVFRENQILMKERQKAGNIDLFIDNVGFG